MAQLNSLLVTGDSRFLNPINGNARNGVYTVIGTQTAATASWTGIIPIPALYDGLSIDYYLPYDGVSSTNVTLNLTLSNGTTTGAKNCYITTGRLTTHYGAGRVIHMTYWSAGSISIKGTATTDDRWICDAYYDTNSDTKVRQTLSTANKNYPLLLSYAESSTTTTNIDNVSYRNNSIFANPSTGTITATNFSGDTVSLKDTADTYTVKMLGEGGSTQGGVLRTYFKNGTLSSFLGSNSTDTNGLIQTWNPDGYKLTDLQTSTSNGGSLTVYTGSNDTNYIGALFSGVNGGVLDLKSSIKFGKTRVLVQTGNADGGLITLRNSSDTDTITIDGHAGKVTASALKIGNYTYGVTSLYSGSLGSGSTTFNYGNYKAYLVVGEVQSSGSWISQLHPKEQILTSNTKYVLSDEIYYITYSLKYSGSTVTLTFNTKSSSGAIRQVWGIN